MICSTLIWRYLSFNIPIAVVVNVNDLILIENTIRGTRGARDTADLRNHRAQSTEAINNRMHSQMELFALCLNFTCDALRSK